MQASLQVSLLGPLSISPTLGDSLTQFSALVQSLNQGFLFLRMGTPYAQKNGTLCFAPAPEIKGLFPRPSSFFLDLNTSQKSKFYRHMLNN
jgi:hypothetical protein